MEKETKKYWLYLVIAWCIHNLEEGLTMSKWLEVNEMRIPPAQFISLSTLQQSLPIALILATLGLIVIPIFAISKKWDNRLFGIVLGICLVNAIGHILTSVAIADYSPGVVTGILLNLPLSLFILKQLFNHNLLKNFTWFHILAYGAIGLILSVSVVWVLAFSLNFIGR